MKEPAKRYEWSQIATGESHTHRYTITPDVFAAFLQAFDDRSSIHIDEAAAVAAGFPAQVMHGAILNGFVSNFIGMRFPGDSALLLSVDMRFAKPSFLNDVLVFTAEVQQRVDAHKVLVLTLSIDNETRGYRAATARIQVKVRDA